MGEENQVSIEGCRRKSWQPPSICPLLFLGARILGFVASLTVKSLKKKWKDKAFAAGANRDVIREGAERMGVELADLFADVIAGMQSVASELGLDGSLAAGPAQSGETNRQP